MVEEANRQFFQHRKFFVSKLYEVICINTVLEAIDHRSKDINGEAHPSNGGLFYLRQDHASCIVVHRYREICLFVDTEITSSRVLKLN